MVRLGQILGALLLFFGLASSAWCMPWVTDAQGKVGWMRDHLWQSHQTVKYMGIDGATQDGAGGIRLSTDAELGIDGALVPFTFEEGSSVAEVAAATAFLPELDLYQLAGAVIGALLWDAATQSYELRDTSKPEATCSDGSLPVWHEVYFGGNYPSFSALLDYLRTYHSDSTTAYYVYGVSGDTVEIYSYDPNLGRPGDSYENVSPQCLHVTPQIFYPNIQVPPPEMPPYVRPWLQANPNQAPPLAGKEAGAGHAPDAGNGPTLSGPTTTTYPPVTTTTTNPDGSSSSSTTTTIINWQYSGPNASGSTSTTTTTSSTPAPTASNPNPTPASGPTTDTSAPSPAPSSEPQNPFVPPAIPMPTPSPVPPGVINLPIPTIDNAGGTCPAPIVLHLGLPGAQTVLWDLTPWCTLATNLRPLVLTAAGLAAAFLLVR
jgi:hypothetical protein